jgi:hypothetical protein
VRQVALALCLTGMLATADARAADWQGSVKVADLEPGTANVRAPCATS